MLGISIHFTYKEGNYNEYKIVPGKEVTKSLFLAERGVFCAWWFAP